ncbi:hypothetical protein J6590_102132 [Homalodisca vitripennis]|nr:hypothetical protein J6590_102132 [Homalodisca vitripennis]
MGEGECQTKQSPDGHERADRSADDWSACLGPLSLLVCLSLGRCRAGCTVPSSSAVGKLASSLLELQLTSTRHNYDVGVHCSARRSHSDLVKLGRSERNARTLLIPRLVPSRFVTARVAVDFDTIQLRRCRARRSPRSDLVNQ